MPAIQKSEFQFSNPLLFEMIFSINREYDFSEEYASRKVPINLNVAKPDLAGCEDRKALVLLTVQVGEKDNKEFPYYLSATMGANFKWDSSLTNEMVDSLLSQNAPALLAGYLRPYIAQITEASPIPTVHLPFINFTPQDK